MTNASNEHPYNDPQAIAAAVHPSAIQERLQAHDQAIYQPGPATRQAAVAIILRESHTGATSDDPEILFIKRADKNGDPWSGHMAFPGGHRESSDLDLRAAAARETHEEIGLDLRGIAQYLGPVDQQRASPRGRELDMLIEPHVFQLTAEAECTLNYEVADVVWAPLSLLMGNSLHGTIEWPMAGTPTIFNGYRLSERHFVWGLTYRMLKSFFQIMHPTWQPPAEIE